MGATWTFTMKLFSARTADFSGWSSTPTPTPALSYSHCPGVFAGVLVTSRLLCDEASLRRWSYRQLDGEPRVKSASEVFCRTVQPL